MKKFTLTITKGVKNQQVTILASDRAIAQNIAKAINEKAHASDHMKWARKG